MPPLYPNTCRACGAPPRQRCRTLTTGKVTDTHAVRIATQFDPDPPPVPAPRR